MAQDKAEIEYQFHQAMLGIYEEALNDVGYRATRFRQMVNRHGGLEAARRLLRGSARQTGCCACGRQAGSILLWRLWCSANHGDVYSKMLNCRRRKCG